MDVVKAFFSSGSGQIAIAVLVVAVFDFLFGVVAAWRDKTFEWSAIDAWIRSNVMGRVMPLWLLLLMGYVVDPFVKIPMVEFPLITPVALGAAALYLAATVASILAKWGPGNVKQGVPTD